MAKRILIIGCGASGIAAIKCCLDEDLEPVCLERTDEMGGLWNYKDEVRDDHSSVMKNTVINTSKEIMAFSDYPMPAEYPNFLHNTQLMVYFKDYMEKFDLKKYVHYNKDVIMIKPADSFETTGRWDVEIRDLKTEEIEHAQFDGVLVCTGHHAEKNVPTFEGLEKFEGKMIHSQEYKHNKGWENKRALVVGIGNSSVDTANDLAIVTSKVFISTRRGTWLIPRNMDNGLPNDITRITRIYNWIGKVLPTSLYARMTEKKLNSLYDHKLYCLQPSHRITEQSTTMSSDLPMNIATGRVSMKGHIERFTKTGVEFMDGSFEDNIDLVVMATGYTIGFPFIDKSVVDVQNNRVNLYKFMFPADIQQPTLAVIGCIQPSASFMPISEIQCRLATRVFKGIVKLPPRTTMLMDIQHKQREMKKRFINSERYTIQVNFIDYMDEIADLIGCKPNLWKYAITDPVLARQCFLGPNVPYQYRLQGPGKWSGARDAVLTVMDRVRKPFQTRPLPDIPSGALSWNSSMYLFICVVFFALSVKMLLL